MDMNPLRNTGSRSVFAWLRPHFLSAFVAFQNVSSKFNAALGVPAQGFCAAPGAKEDI